VAVVGLMGMQAIRSDAHAAEAALRRADDLGHALAVRKLLASHATLAAENRRLRAIEKLRKASR
jgi:hypothetical protein